MTRLKEVCYAGRSIAVRVSSDDRGRHPETRWRRIRTGRGNQGTASGDGWKNDNPFEGSGESLSGGGSGRGHAIDSGLFLGVLGYCYLEWLHDILATRLSMPARPMRTIEVSP